MKINIISHSRHPLPAYETTGAAGMDLRALLDAPVTLQPLERTLIPTGLHIELPDGMEAQIRPRSGMAFKKGLTVANAPGTIDADYRGEIKVILVNLSGEPQIIEDGDRIAQMVIARYEHIYWQQTDQLTDTDRGAGGFGHTGQQ